MAVPHPPLEKDQEFGKLKVKNPEYDEKMRVLVECRCSHEFWVRHLYLRNGKSTRCVKCANLLKKLRVAPETLKVSRGEIYKPWEVLEDAIGSKARVRVRCIGCNQRTTRKLFGIVDNRHTCLKCFNKNRGKKFVIFEGRMISLVELMKSADTLTIVASSIQATPRENIRKQISEFIAETGRINQTPQAVIVQTREGQ